MAKLDRNSLRIINFVLTENGQGVLKVNSINVSADDMNGQHVNITDLTPENEAILASEVAELVKKILRYQYMNEEE